MFVWISAGLALSIFNTIQVSSMRNSPFIDTSRVRVIDGIFFSFGCIYNARTFILRQVSIWFGIILTQTSTWVYKDSLTLTYAPNINIWLVLQFWYPWVGSLVPLLLLVIDTMHLPIYQTNTGLDCFWGSGHRQVLTNKLPLICCGCHSL